MSAMSNSCKPLSKRDPCFKDYCKYGMIASLKLDTIKNNSIIDPAAFCDTCGFNYCSQHIHLHKQECRLIGYHKVEIDAIKRLKHTPYRIRLYQYTNDRNKQALLQVINAFGLYYTEIEKFMIANSGCIAVCLRKVKFLQTYNIRNNLAKIQLIPRLIGYIPINDLSNLILSYI